MPVADEQRALDVIPPVTEAPATPRSRVDVITAPAGFAGGHPDPLAYLIGRLLAITEAMLGRWRRLSAPHRGETVLLSAISRIPDVWGGAAVVKGTRVPVFAIADEYARAEREPELDPVRSVMRAFPTLTAAAVFAALAYSFVRPGEVRADREAYMKSVPDHLH